MQSLYTAGRVQIDPGLVKDAISLTAGRVQIDPGLVKDAISLYCR